jgi:hypothetical protein
MKKLISVLAFGLVACGGAQGGGAETGGDGTGISRDAFIRMAHDNLPGVICAEEEHPLRACMTVTEDVCVIALTSLIDRCSDDLGGAIPDTIPDTEEDGARYGRVLGQCINSGYIEESREAGNYRTGEPGCE